METVDNNQFEVKPVNSKRKLSPTANVYLNPALDLLANEDRMCNTAMEIVPNKKRKQMKNNIAAFENTALDLGISKAAVNDFLVRELNNVTKNCKFNDEVANSVDNDGSCQPNAVIDVCNEIVEDAEPIYANISNVTDLQSITDCRSNISQAVYEENTIPINNTDGNELDSGISIFEKNVNTAIANSPNITNIETNITNHIFINNPNNVSLSFIDRLTLDSPNVSNQSLFLDDDLNESNIMEIKTITVITKRRQTPQKVNTTPQRTNTNPFLDPNLDVNYDAGLKQNPFLELPEPEYSEEAVNRPVETQIPHITNLIPRQLFTGDTNSTISTVNESSIHGDCHEYENIDEYRAESPIYENVSDGDIQCDKQSKILGCDVSRFTATDIMNLNKFSQTTNSNDSSDSRKDLKNLFKVGKLSKKVFKTLKKTFKTDKPENNISLNPYEVPRKPPKQKASPKESGIENPALNLDNSDEIEVEEVYDEEHEYETIKTIRNTRLNANVTPLREKTNEVQDISQKFHTPGKKVRFDSTLNQEKVITGDSFDYDIQSPGFDSKIDKYHDELENCINERKILQQNM